MPTGFWGTPSTTRNSTTERPVLKTWDLVCRGHAIPKGNGGCSGMVRHKKYEECRCRKSSLSAKAKWKDVAAGRTLHQPGTATAKYVVRRSNLYTDRRTNNSWQGEPQTVKWWGKRKPAPRLRHRKGKRIGNDVMHSLMHLNRL